jgi:hypothetical protein
MKGGCSGELVRGREGRDEEVKEECLVIVGVI